MTTRRNVLAGVAAVAATGFFPAIAAAGGIPASAEAVAAEGRVVILPDLYRLSGDVPRFAEDNAWTYVHDWMTRWDFGAKTMETAKVGSDAYRDWLRRDPPKDGIPPHVAFGGAVVPGEGDPDFHARWKRRTLAKLASGELA